MKPVDYLHRVEGMTIDLFESFQKACLAADNERKVFGPQKQYYQYIFEHRAQIEEYDDETLNHHYGKLAEAHQALLLANVAAGAAAGAILQIARQCISLTWKKYGERVSKGRMVGSQNLSSVIWHARNQALHFEEGAPKNEHTEKSIRLLSDEFGIDTSNLDENPRPLSVEIFRVLEWQEYESYVRDMVKMVEEP